MENSHFDIILLNRGFSSTFFLLRSILILLIKVRTEFSSFLTEDRKRKKISGNHIRERFYRKILIKSFNTNLYQETRADKKSAKRWRKERPVKKKEKETFKNKSYNKTTSLKTSNSKHIKFLRDAKVILCCLNQKQAIMFFSH